MGLTERSVALYAAGAQNWANFDRGIPRYVGEHLRALHALAPEIIESVLLNPLLPLTGNLGWLLGSRLLDWNSEHGLDSRRRSASRATIYHVMSPFEGNSPLEIMWPRWAREPRISTVVTVYDLIPMIFADHYLDDPWPRAEYTARLDLVRRADGILAISQATADDVVTHLGVPEERVHVIHAGAAEVFGGMYTSKEAAWQHLERHQRRVRRGFVLYVGGFEFRKNLRNLLAGYARLTPELRFAHQLVIACRMVPEHMQTLRELAEELGIDTDDLLLTGYVSDADLGALYHACTLFAFPSLYEGSGLPMLEAMACGVPVIASSTSTGPEILGDLEGTFDPSSPEAIARCLADTLTSEETLARLTERSRGRVGAYTWRRVAEESLAGYEKVLALRPPARKPRPRLALVTPWPPEESGIAGYNFRLAQQLGRLADVDIVVGRPLSSYTEPREQGVRLVAADRLEMMRRLRQYDRIVYCMGNSSFHGFIFELLKAIPGSVVFHDVRLTGFFGWLAGVQNPGGGPAKLAEWIEAAYGTRVAPEAKRPDREPSWDLQLALGLFMTRELQSYADQCFVHSRYAQDVLNLERGELDREVPVSILPFGIPESTSGPRPAETVVAPLIVSFGFLHEVKGIANLVAAFSLLVGRMPEARLVLAGPKEPHDPERWQRYVDEHAPGTNIEITGRVDDERYAELLQSADLAVQLRLISNGEASATVADCLASGVPTIVTDLGWTADLPDGVVSKVAPEASAERLADQMAQLLRDGDRRHALSAAAIEHARSCSFADVASAYLEALGL